MINNHQLLIIGYCAINPILSLIVYSNITKGLSLIQRIGIAFSSMLFVVIIFIACVYFGKVFLAWFGVPVYVIQLGGGLLTLIVGIGQMLITEQMVEMRSFMHKMTAFGQNVTNPPRLNSGLIFDSYQQERRISLGLFPLAVPIMINPVSILIMLFEGLDTNLTMQPRITLILIAICVIQGLVLFNATRIGRSFGQIGLLTISRVAGLGLTIIAFEMLVTGLKSLMPIIIGG